MVTGEIVADFSNFPTEFGQLFLILFVVHCHKKQGILK